MSKSIAQAATDAGMNVQENKEQIDKAHEAQLQDDAAKAELAETPVDTDVPSAGFYAMNIHHDKDGNTTPECFQDVLNTIAPELAETLPDFVDKTYWSTWTDIFRVTNLVQLEFGILPTFADVGRGWAAAQSPESFAFDKDTAGYTEANDTEGVIEPMSWQEIQAKRAEGLKPMSNSQFQFLIETSQRVLDGNGILHTLKNLGYQSSHTAEDVFAAARESEEKRAKSWQERQELEGYKRKEQSAASLKEATENGSLVI